MRNTIAIGALLALSIAGCAKSSETGHFTTMGEEADVYVAADPGACEPDYSDKAWHICGIVVPAPSEDFYTLSYANGGWILTIHN